MSPQGTSASGPVAEPDLDTGDRSGSRTRRVFIAIPLSEAARREVADLVDTVRTAADPDVRDVRWVRLDGLHLTLRFIGQVDESRLEAIASAVQAVAAGLDGFQVTIHGAGAFPSPSRPRTLWLGVTTGTDELAAAAGALENALAAAGVDRSTRPFRAHLTLARSDGIRSGPEVARRLIESGDGRTTTFEATQLVLFETIQGGGPARYAPLLVAPLRPPPAAETPTSAIDTGATIQPSVEPRTSLTARRKERRPGT